MQLVLERCTIRPWRLDDAESLARHANNRKIWLALRDLFPHPYTTEDAHKFLEATVKDSSRSQFFVLRLTARPSAGSVFIQAIDVHRHTAELGYWLGEEFWGRGIMTEAVGAFTDFCFDNFRSAESLRRCLRTIPHPHACWKKPASAFEGRLKNNVMKDGQVLDSLLYARTK